MIVYVSADPSYGIPCECSKGLFDLPIYYEIHLVFVDFIEFIDFIGFIHFV
jgi:hypothetical protein